MDLIVNNTTPGNPVHKSRNTLAYVHFVIGTYIIVSNGLVVTAIRKFSYLRTRAFMYIASLACTDLCVGLIEWSVGLHNHDILAAWFDRTAPACVGMFSFAFFSVACSMFNMVLIALDRFLFIMQPFYYTSQVTGTKVKLAILLVWILAAVWGSVPLYIHTYDVSTEPHCTMQAAIPSVYRAYSNVPIVFTCALVTGFVYIFIGRKALEHQKAISRAIPKVTPSGKPGASAWVQTEKAARPIRQSMKTLKLFIIVFGLLIVCWLPYFVIEFTSDFVAWPDKVYRASTALGFLNSGVNFFVYAMNNRKFRRALYTLVCPCCKGQLAGSHSYTTAISRTRPSVRADSGPSAPDLDQSSEYYPASCPASTSQADPAVGADVGIAVAAPGKGGATDQRPADSISCREDLETGSRSHASSSSSAAGQGARGNSVSAERRQDSARPRSPPGPRQAW